MRNLARAPMPLIARFYFVLMLSAAGVCQLPSSRCDEMAIALEDCPYLVQTSVGARASISTPTNFADGISESFFRAPLPKWHKTVDRRLRSESSTMTIVAICRQLPYSQRNSPRWHLGNL